MKKLVRNTTKSFRKLDLSFLLHILQTLLLVLLPADLRLFHSQVLLIFVVIMFSAVTRITREKGRKN